MFIRNRIPLMEGADPQQPAAPAQPAVPAPTPTPAPAPAAAALPDDLQKLVSNPDAFKQRLAEERNAAVKQAMKDLGIKDTAEGRARFEELQKLKDAQMSDQERAKKQIDDLAPKAARATALEAAVKTLLETEEKLIPDDKRSLLDLAPSADQPEARLTWIANAKAKGLFAPAAAPVVPTTPVEPPKPPANPATTMGPGGPTPPPPAGTKSPYQVWQDLVSAGKDIRAARFYTDNRKAIEASRPQK